MRIPKLLMRVAMVATLMTSAVPVAFAGMVPADSDGLHLFANDVRGSACDDEAHNQIAKVGSLFGGFVAVRVVETPQQVKAGRLTALHVAVSPASAYAAKAQIGTLPAIEGTPAVLAKVAALTHNRDAWVVIAPDTETGQDIAKADYTVQYVFSYGKTCEAMFSLGDWPKAPHSVLPDNVFGFGS